MSPGHQRTRRTPGSPPDATSSPGPSPQGTLPLGLVLPGAGHAKAGVVRSAMSLAQGPLSSPAQ